MGPLSGNAIGSFTASNLAHRRYINSGTHIMCRPEQVTKRLKTKTFGMPELRLAGAPVSSHKGDVFVKAKSYQDSWHKLIATLFKRQGCIGLPKLERSSRDTRDAPVQAYHKPVLYPTEWKWASTDCWASVVD
jgi:hypothetical protein